MEFKILKDLVIHIIPGVSSRYFIENNGLPCKIVTINSIADGKINPDLLDSRNLGPLTMRGATIDGCQLRYGDVVISEKGPVFKAALVDFDLENCFVSPNITAFRLHQSIKPQIIVEFLNSPVGQLALVSTSRGSKYLFVHRSDILDLKVPVPSLELQIKLVGYCDSVDSYLTSLKKEETLIRDMKRHIITTAFEVTP